MWSADPSPPLFFYFHLKGVGQTANAVYIEASPIAQKHDKTYSKTLSGSQAQRASLAAMHAQVRLPSIGSDAN